MRLIPTLALPLAAALLAAPAAHASLIITEVMSSSLNPGASAGGGGADGDWFELSNTGPAAVDLTGYTWEDDSFPNGDNAVFPSFSLAAGRSVVVLQEAQATSTFRGAWGGTFDILYQDQFGGPNIFSGLSSNGDQVNVADPSGTLVDNATFGAATPGSSFAWDANNASLGLSVAGQNGAYQELTDGAGGPGVDVASPGFAAGLSSVPEPASLGLIGLAGFALVRRRRA